MRVQLFSRLAMLTVLSLLGACPAFVPAVKAAVTCSSTNYAVGAQIPDNNVNGLASTKTFSTPIGIVTDLNVELKTTGGYNGDLYVYLVHDSGFTVLLNRVGRTSTDPFGYGDAGFNLIFDDQSGSDVHLYRVALFGNSTTPLAGALTNSWLPDGRATDPFAVVDTDTRTELLSSFNGLNPNGSWTLFAADLSPVDAATLDSWGLDVCGLPPTPASIPTQSGDQTVECSSNVTLSVTIAGTGPFTNQWYYNGGAIPNATNTSLALANLHAANSGPYTFAVCNMAGCITSAPIVLTITDTMPPVIACPGTIVAGTSFGTCASNVTFAPTAADGCSTVTVVCVPASGSSFAKGPTTVTCTATDTSANTNACTFTVMVNDTQIPSVTCPGNIVVSAAGGTCASNVTFSASATDNCPGVTTNCIPASGSSFAKGVTTVTCTATDASGNTNACTFTVTVNDTQPPTIACPANITTNITTGCSTTVGFTNPVVSDNCPGGTFVCVPASGATFSLGTTTVTCTPIDASTNVGGACSFTVTVTAAAPSISAQPANQIAPMGNGAVFSVTAAGTGPLIYQWYSNGVSIAGATASSVAVSNLLLSASGSQFNVTISNCISSVTSAVAVLTVTPISGISYDFNTPNQYTNIPYNLVGNDWQAGGVSAANPSLNTTQPWPTDIQFETATGGVGVATGGGALDLTFANGVDHTMILTPLTYDFSSSGKVLTVSMMTKIKVPTAGQRAIQMGFITATNGQDSIGKQQTAGINGTANLGWMSAIFQSTVVNVINPSYQLRGQHKVVSGTATTETIPLNSPTNTLTTNNWYKLLARFTNMKGPAGSVTASNYMLDFTVQDMGAAGTVGGAIVLGLSGQMQTNVDMVNQSRLYFAVRGFENGGNDYWDNVYVTTQPGAMAMVQGLSSPSVAQGRTALFQALVDGDGPYAYQWFKNGAAIPGAGNWKYTTPPLLLSDNGAKYSVSVSGPSSSISSTGTVTVVADALDVLSVGSVEGSVIGLRFDQPVTKASAETPANYTINGVAAVAAQLLVNNGVQQYRTNGTEVLLTPATVVSGVFTVAVANVTSLSGTVVGANNTATGVVAGLTGLDVDPTSIGENWQVPTLPGYGYSFAPGQFTITGGGHDIFGVYDGFRYTYKTVTGDFDIKTRIPYQDVVRIATKAGFDVRVSLDPAAPNVGAFVDPMLPGRNFYEGTTRQLYNVLSTSWGNGTSCFYPDTWLRIRRVGNTLMRYSSTNGVSWLFDGQISPFPAFPPTVYVGLALNCNVGAGVIQQYNTAQFDNYGDFAGYGLATIANVTGPSNIIVAAGSAATFTNTATYLTNGVAFPAAGELAYLWQRTNTAAGGWTNMPSGGATNNILNTGALYFSDNGGQYRVIISAPGALSVTSGVATVTVTDVAAPTVAGNSSAAYQSPNQLVINFSELMGASALVAANYSVTNGAGVSVGVASVSFLNGDPRTVVITTTSPLIGGTNRVGISGVKDLNNNSVAAGTVVSLVQSVAPTSASGPQLLGPVVTEWYTALASFGGATHDLINNPKYSRGDNYPMGSPDFYQYSNVFGIHPNAFPSPGWGENYGVRMYSYFRPPTNGVYKWFTRVDDFAEFIMNTNTVNSMLPMDLIFGVVATAGTVGPGTISTNTPINQDPWMCMDNYTNSKYLNFSILNTGFIVSPAAGGSVVNGIRLATAADAPERDPASFTVEGTAGDPRLSTTVWTLIASDTTGLTSGLSSNRLTYIPDIRFTNAAGLYTNTAFYTSYRVLFPTVRGFFATANSMQIAEVNLLGTNGVNNTPVQVTPSGATLQYVTTANNAAYLQDGTHCTTNTLNGGQLYYVEFRWKEGTGGDGGCVQVRNDTLAAIPAQTEVLSNYFLVFPTNLAPYTPVQFEAYSSFSQSQSAGNGNLPDLISVTNATNFIARIPNINGYTKIFGWNTNLLQVNGTMDNYLGRIYAYFVAPTNGLYKFWMRSDDSSQLFMNTNALNSTDPAGMSLLGQLSAFTSAYTLAGQNVSLNAGQRYYMEARWREGGGGDGINVAVRSQGDGGTPGIADTIPGSFFELATNELRYGPIKLAGITPNNPTVNEGQVITFQAVGVSGEGSAQGSIANTVISTTTAAAIGTFEAAPLSNLGLVWMKNGGNVFANQLFAGQMYYVTQPLTFADNGTVITLLVSNTFSIATQSVTITVIQDTVAPTIASAVASQYGNTVLVTFSEPVDPLTSQSLANYRIPGLQILSVKRDDVRRDRVILQTVRQTAGAVYTLTVNGVRDLSLAGNTIAANSTKNFTAWGFGGVGSVYVEIFTNIPGALDEFLEFSPKYVYDMPDISYYTNNFGLSLFATDSGLNNYAARISGCFMPPSNGLYRFFVRGDDGTRIYMNTNGPDPSGRLLIARNDAANSGTYQNGTGLGIVGASISPILSLTNGTFYYMETIFKEGTGGDHAEVYMAAIDPGTLTEIGGVPTPAAGQALTGSLFCAPGNPDNFNIVSGPPAQITVVEDNLFSLSVLVQILASYPLTINPALPPPVAVQWQRFNGVSYTNIPGATATTYSQYAAATDNGAQLRVTVSMPGVNQTFNTLVHVLTDTNAPFIIGASSLNGTNIDLCYNERVDPNTAGDNFLYTVNGGANNVQAATLRTNNASQVQLLIDPPLPPGQPFTVQVTGVADLAANANIGDSSAIGRVQGYTALDVGAPAGGGSSFSCKPGEIDVFAGGADIWSTADQGHMTLTPRTGNFDINLRVQSVSRAVGDTDNINKAGLMIRDSFDPAARTLHILLEPPAAVGGRDFYEAGERPTLGAVTAAWDGGSATGTGPANLPNGWVRIKRTGNLFTAFRSADGSNWTVSTTTTLSLSNQVYVGLGTTAHVPVPSASTIFAEFRDIHIPDPPTIVTPPSPPVRTVPLHSLVSYNIVVNNPANSGPVAYQWQHNGIDIPGATNATLTFNNAMVSDSGTYTVTAGNDGGYTPVPAVLLIVSNALPVVVNDSMMATQNISSTITAASLLANDSDPEHDSISLVAVSGIFPVTFAADFNAGAPAGATNFGNAALISNGGTGDSGHLELNPSVANATGSLVINELTPGRRVAAFGASFNLKIYQGSAEPADGMSFNFGNDLPDTAATPANAEQGGTATGFSFCVDNYRFQPISVGAAYNTTTGGNVNTSGLKVNYKGVVVAIVQTPGAWNVDRYVPVTISVQASGACTITVDGTNAFGTFTLPGYAPAAGRFGIYARCGGSTQAHELDDLSITVNTLETSRQAAPELGGAYGTVSLNGGNITYNPPTNSCGLDSYYYIVSDGQTGGQSTGRVDVVIKEAVPTPPVIVACVTNTTLALPAGQCQMALPDLTAQLNATDNCCCLTRSQSPAPGTLMGIGSTTLTFIVTDTAGLSATCTALVVVADVTPPTIVCSTNITLDCTGLAGTLVNYAVTGTDDCNPSPTLACAPPSGVLYGNGITTVNCSLNDGHGNSTNCSFTVTILDRLAPVVVCPTNRVIHLAAGQCNATVTYANATYTDCDTNSTVVCAPPSGSIFPAGTNVTVTCTVTDHSSNSTTCGFTVTILEGIKPSIVCPPDVVVECGNPTLPPATGVATAIDNCDPSVLITRVDHGATEVRPGSLSGWTLTAVGDPATATATFVNGPAPAPLGTGTLRLYLGTNGDAVAQARTTNFNGTLLSALTEMNFRTFVTASSGNGECPFVLLNIDSDGNGTADDVIGFEPEYQSGYTLAVPDQGLVVNGVWQKWDAMVGGWWSINHPGVMTDASGVKSLATYIAAFPNARIVNASSGVGGVRLVAGQSFGTWENFDGNVDRFTMGVNGTSSVYDFDLTPGDPNPVIVRTWTATDHSGNAISCSQIINVIDTTPPTLSCPAALLVKTTNPAGTNVSFSVNPADSCDAHPTLVCAPASGSFFAMGATPVQCVVTDSAGNSNSCSFVVTVNLIDGATYSVNATIPDNDPNGYASTKTVASQIGRLTDVNVRLNISGGYNGDLYAYLVHDSGYAVLLNRVGRRSGDPLGYGDTGFNVTIDDQAANGDVHVYRQTLFGNQTSPLAGPLTNSWAPDGRATDPAVVLSADARTELLSSFNGLNPNGSWTLFIADLGSLDTASLVSWSLDLCGLPPIPPAITIQPQNQTTQCSSNAIFTVATTGTLPLTNQWYRNGVLLAGENGSNLVRPASISANGDIYSVIVSGMGGSVTSAPASLTVIDTIAPVVVCPGNIVAECLAPAGSVVSFTPTVIEGCSVGLVAVCVPASGSLFAPGLTTVNCSATDAAHNVGNSCSFTVRVVDTTPPTFCNNSSVVLTAGGTNDNFAGVEAASPSQDLKDLLFSLNLRGFDDGGSDRWFAHTFTNLPANISDAVLRIRLKGDAGIPQNDVIELLFATPGGGLLPASWNRRIGTGGFDAIPGLLPTPWASNSVTELVLNLGQLRNVDNSFTDLLPTLHAQRYLDVVVQEDTVVDYVVLEIKTCQCRSNITATINTNTCGAVVTFATPLFSDTCDTNIPVVCSPASGSVFPIGTTTVFCAGTDDSGNIGHCSFDVVVTEPASHLRIERAGANVLISWPVTCAHYRLLQAPSLTPPATWIPVVAPSSISGGEYHVLQPATGPYHFYKLVTP